MESKFGWEKNKIQLRHRDDCSRLAAYVRSGQQRVVANFHKKAIKLKNLFYLF
jgi:hypothetical protein